MKLLVLLPLFVFFISSDGFDSMFGQLDHSYPDDECECDPGDPPSISQDSLTTTPVPPPPHIAHQCPNTIGKLGDPNPPPADSCDEGWTAFRRIKGIRCLKTFTGGYNQSTAEELCWKHESVLAGLENSDERDWLHEQFRPLLKENQEYRTVWVGGYTKPECMLLENLPSYCLPKETSSFYWTDPSVTGIDGFCPWWDTAPDNVEGKLITPCLHFTILKNAEPVTKWRATQGSLDDVVCYLAAPTIIGYVCSKAPLS